MLIAGYVYDKEKFQTEKGTVQGWSFRFATLLAQASRAVAYLHCLQMYT